MPERKVLANRLFSYLKQGLAFSQIQVSPVDIGLLVSIDDLEPYMIEYEQIDKDPEIIEKFAWALISALSGASEDTQ